MTYATKDFYDSDAAFLQWLDPARLAYIKTTTTEQARRLGIIPAGMEMPAGTLLYVLHDADGQVLGYTDAWASAYGTARRNDLTLLSVH